MTSGTRLGLALIASFVLGVLSAKILDSNPGGMFLGLLVGVGIILAVPVKKSAPKA